MFQELIKEIANELGIKCTLFSKDWCILLEKNGVSKIINGYKFSINEQGPSLIADDKYALYELMKIRNVPIIKHQILYKNKDIADYAKDNGGFESALNYFYANNKDIVLKPNNGTTGIDVYHINDVDTLKKTFDKLFISNHSVSMCPFYKIKTEYRVIFLNGNLELTFGKERPIIVGDGKKSVRELLIEFNPYYFNNEKSFFNKDIDLNYIPKKDEKIEYGWQFNLARGARVLQNVNEDSRKKAIEIAKEAYNASSLKFCSIDVIETEDNEYMVMEINSGVSITKYPNFVANGREIAKKIYKDAIIEMFKGTK